MYDYFYNTIMTGAFKKRVQKAAIYAALINANIQPDNIDFYSYSENGKKCVALAISELTAFSQYDSAYLLNLANIIELQKTYDLPITVNNMPEADVFVMADSHAPGADIELGDKVTILFKLDAPIVKDISNTLYNILNDIASLKSYPAIGNSDEIFLNFEHEIKHNYLACSWLNDMENKYFHWEYEYMRLQDYDKYFNGAYKNEYDGLWQFLIEHGLNTDLIDNLYDSCSVIDCHADINIENAASVALAKEIKQIIRQYALEKRYNRIYGWRKNWQTLPGITIKPRY